MTNPDTVPTRPSIQEQLDAGEVRWLTNEPRPVSLSYLDDLKRQLGDENVMADVAMGPEEGKVQPAKDVLGVYVVEKTSQPKS